ncbi:MAG: tetratricopeptide repeat protein [Pseudomonadota bacterium]
MTAALIVASLALAACESADERAQRHYERGLELLKDGDSTKAGLEFRNALKLRDNMPGVHMELGRIAQTSGNIRAALGHYQAAVGIDETLLDAHFRIGQIMLLAGQLDEALRFSTTAFQLAPQDPRILALKAAVALKLENFDSARDTANEALAIDGTNTDARMVLAALAANDGDLPGSLGELAIAMEHDPKNVAVHIFRVNVLEKAGRISEIGPALEALIAHYPDNANYRQSLVRWHLRRGNDAEAEAELRVIAEQNPENTGTALNVVQFLNQKKGYDAARAELASLIDKTEDAERRFVFESNLARLDAANGKRDDALAQLQTIISSSDIPQVKNSAKVLFARLKLINAANDGAVRADVKGMLQEVLTADASNTDALYLSGQLELAEDNYDRAIEYLRSALNEAPNSAPVLLLLATAHERAGRPDLAGERMASAVQVSNYAPQAALAYARFLARSPERREFAAGVLEDAIQRAPRNVQMLRALANLRLQLNDWVGAEEIAQQLRQLEDGGSADQIIAASLSGQERFDESISILQESNEARGNTRSNMAAMVAALLRSDRLPAAKEFVANVLADNPKNAEAHLLMASLNLREQDFGSAEEHYRAAVESDPESIRAYSTLAAFYVQQNRPDEAREVLDAGLEKRPEAAPLILVRANFYEKTGEFDKAIADYERLYTLRPSSYLVANNLASLLTDFRSDPESLERAGRVAQRLSGSDVPQFQDTYGWVQYLRGEYDEAVTILEPAAEALPNNLLVQYHLGMAYAKAEKPELARKQLEKVVAMADGKEFPQLAAVKSALKGLETAPQQGQ